MRVLLSDGSGLTSRQVATQLHRSGHTVGVVAPRGPALTRFTRHVRRVHTVPRYGRDPFGWLEATLDVLRHWRYDVLLPTQEQVAVLSREVRSVRDTGARIAVPPFAALRQVQDKISAHATLLRAGLAQPATDIAVTPAELIATDRLPAYVKTPIGTASTGVRHVRDRTELRSLAADLEARGDFARGGVVVQQPAPGPLVMLQAVFDRGNMIASHANLRTRLGADGGASGKRSVALPEVWADVARLGTTLAWHGALGFDLILSPAGPVFIDVNPRLVEPGNAWRAGVDLVAAMLDVSLGKQAVPPPPGRVDVRTHQLLLALLGAAQQGRGRRGVLLETARALLRRGPYSGSAEELTPLAGDFLAPVPVAAVAVALTVSARLSRLFTGGAVDRYALTPDGWLALTKDD